MGFDLPSNDEERELFLRALREYSENCEPPELTPDCPYSVETTTGVRGCCEECMDLLGKHRAPDPSEVVDLDGVISIRRSRRPRARRTSDNAAKAFDAREMFLSDQASGEPIERWRPPTGIVDVGQGQLLDIVPGATAAECSAPLR